MEEKAGKQQGRLALTLAERIPPRNLHCGGENKLLGSLRTRSTRYIYIYIDIIYSAKGGASKVINKTEFIRITEFSFFKTEWCPLVSYTQERILLKIYRVNATSLKKIPPLKLECKLGPFSRSTLDSTLHDIFYSATACVVQVDRNIRPIRQEAAFRTEEK